MNAHDAGTDPQPADAGAVDRTIPLGELTRGATVACIDGRHDHCIVGAPGGNMGEFVLLLTALEAVGPPVTDREVAELLDGYLREFGRFYMHTDRAALDWVAQRLGRERLEADEIEAAPAELRGQLLQLLTDPCGVGCGHLHAMLASPQTYQVRPELVRAAIRAFFDEIWNHDTGADLDYVVLEGEHEEDELLVYETADADALTDATPIPMGCTNGNKRFVLHDAARRYLLRKSRDYLAEVRKFDPVQRETFESRIDELAGVQLEATRQALFPDLPTRTVHIGEEGGGNP
jgi:hypothetical protein